MNTTLTLMDLAGAVALLIWGVHMVQTGITRAYGPQLRRILGYALGNRFKAFLAGGFAALANKPRGGKVSVLTVSLLERVRAELATGTRTWTAAPPARPLCRRWRSSTTWRRCRRRSSTMCSTLTW